MVCRPRTLAVALALAAWFVALPDTARADCPAQPLDRTFLPWLDAAFYEAAPDGGVEAGGQGWTLAGGAAVVDGNEPYLDGARALSLPSGASATTAPMCVDLAHPTVRFFARGGTLLTVTALFTDALGGSHELPVGAVAASPAWAPSLPMPVVANVLAREVRFRFTALGGWLVDDVFVDPYSKG
jgi:hypothetical protein